MGGTDEVWMVGGSSGLLPLKVCSQRGVAGLGSLLVSRISTWEEEQGQMSPSMPVHLSLTPSDQ